jgi:periplasmic protein TonB
MNDLGSFSQCLVEGDVEALGRARKLRRKAVGASVAFEILLVSAMLLVPLITTAVLPQAYNVTPVPPYAAPREADLPRQHVSPPQSGEPHPQTVTIELYQPTHSPAHVDTTASDEPPSIGETPGTDAIGIPGGPGTGTPFGTGDHAVIPPPPMTERHEPVRKISIGVMEGSLVYRIDPQYPDIARHGHITGEVKVRATIAVDGTVKDWEVLSGNPIFVKNTIAAIRQWRYKPTRLNGEPVEVETIITVNFVMN